MTHPNKRYVVSARHIRDDQDLAIYETDDALQLIKFLAEQLVDDKGADYVFTITSDFQSVGQPIPAIPEASND